MGFTVEVEEVAEYGVTAASLSGESISLIMTRWMCERTSETLSLNIPRGSAGRSTYLNFFPAVSHTGLSQDAH